MNLNKEQTDYTTEGETKTSWIYIIIAVVIIAGLGYLAYADYNERIVPIKEHNDSLRVRLDKEHNEYMDAKELSETKKGRQIK